MTHGAGSSSDAPLGFQQLLRGWAPAVKGSAEQRAAFMYSIYDRADLGELTHHEMAKLVQAMKVGCCFEHDLLGFSRLEGGMKRTFSFDDYLAHVAADGESAFIKRLDALVLGQ